MVRANAGQLRAGGGFALQSRDKRLPLLHLALPALAAPPPRPLLAQAIPPELQTPGETEAHKCLETPCPGQPGAKYQVGSQGMSGRPVRQGPVWAKAQACRGRPPLCSAATDKGGPTGGPATARLKSEVPGARANGPLFLASFLGRGLFLCTISSTTKLYLVQDPGGGGWPPPPPCPAASQERVHALLA